MTNQTCWTIHKIALFSFYTSRTESAYGRDLVLPKILRCLENTSSVSHQAFKGALYVLTGEARCFVYSWSDAAVVFPAVIRAQHSDKESIVELLKDFYYKTSRSYTEFVPGAMSIMAPKVRGN